MAFASVLALFTILVMQPLLSTSHAISPSFGDNMCKIAQCGKGKCKASNSNIFFFECVCDSGWKNTLPNGDKSWKFLPCIIPNCTLDYSCSNSSAPVPAAPPPPQRREALKSIFDDACQYIHCGGGSCKKKNLSYKCECNDGYDNLLNIDILPCIKECSVGMDCAGLGISGNTTGHFGINEASSILRGSSLWLVMLIMLMAKLQLQ